MEDISYHGAKTCQGMYKKGGKCKNNAYYRVKDGLTPLRCGYHSKKNNRTDLPKDPQAKEKELQKMKDHFLSVESVATDNRVNNVAGKVICSKLRMFKGYRQEPGYLNIFPNNRHQNRTDGFGCCSLSPMRLGPVIHNQPGLPIAKNIENFHQGNKCFPSEMDEKGNPKPIFYETQKKLYLDSVPDTNKQQNRLPRIRIYPYFLFGKRKIVKKKGALTFNLENTIVDIMNNYLNKQMIIKF